MTAEPNLINLQSKMIRMVFIQRISTRLAHLFFQRQKDITEKPHPQVAISLQFKKCGLTNIVNRSCEDDLVNIKSIEGYTMPLLEKELQLLEDESDADDYKVEKTLQTLNPGCDDSDN